MVPAMTSPPKCERCGGSGKVWSFVYRSTLIKCPTCKGTGKAKGGEMSDLYSEMQRACTEAAESGEIVTLLRGTKFGGVIEAERAADEIEKLREALAYWKDQSPLHYAAGKRATAAEIGRLRAEAAEAKAGHAHLMESYQALGRECYEKLGKADAELRASNATANFDWGKDRGWRAGLERAEEIADANVRRWGGSCGQGILEDIRAELASPVRKEE